MTERRVILNDPTDYLKLGKRAFKKILLSTLVIGSLSFGLWDRLERLDLGVQRKTTFVSDVRRKNPELILSVNIFLTSGTQLNRDATFPAWNPFNNHIDCIGGGGGGGSVNAAHPAGGGGGGGGWVRYNNMGWLPTTVNYYVGAGGGPGIDGGTTDFIGLVQSSGGTAGWSDSSRGKGGVGVYGHTGAYGGYGGNGGNASAHQPHGGGGGGAAGSAAGNGNNGESLAINTPVAPGGAGGSTAYNIPGGVTGPPATAGGNGSEYGTAGAGAGGGGGTMMYNGANGGLYGGGGGGASAYGGTPFTGGYGGQGLIFVTYVPLQGPIPTGLSPAKGPAEGGQAVTINGSMFYNVTSVEIGGVPITNMIVVNSNTITGVTGAHAPGTVGIKVNASGGVAPGVGSNFYTYTTAPVVLSCDPNSGLITGNTTITIYGSGFNGATSITVGGIAGIGVFAIDNFTVQTIVPAHAAGTVDITVNVPGIGSGTGVGLYLYRYPFVEFNNPMMGF